MANQQFMYTLPIGKTVQGMMDVTRQYLSIVEGMETQTINTGSSNMLAIQARAKNGGLKQFVGMDKALTVRFIESGNSVTVELGEAKWGDKAAIMATAMFILWPLALTSGYGIYKQKKLPSNIKRVIDDYIYS
ncbi:hypothetical protein [uncultured Oscillibacter sp.]|uniref:hypothetical protein n=1 Tax=uncultured Oscillibacter sp. TaxID=876091 RepID=UPI0025EADC5D|nr:hypothetical protein [uncultured Oscillibacter sp.]